MQVGDGQDYDDHPATVTLTAFETADLCSTPARHGSMNLFKVHIKVLCTQTLTQQQQSGGTSVFNHMQKGFKDMRQNPTHDPSHCALIPIPRVVVVEGFLVNALQCKKVNAIYGFTNSNLRNVIHS